MAQEEAQATEAGGGGFASLHDMLSGEAEVEESMQYQRQGRSGAGGV